MTNFVDKWLPGFTGDGTVRLLEGDKKCGLYRSSYGCWVKDEYRMNVMYHIWVGSMRFETQKYPLAYYTWLEWWNHKD